jgi:hypothetical protein
MRVLVSIRYRRGIDFEWVISALLLIITSSKDSIFASVIPIIQATGSISRLLYVVIKVGYAYWGTIFFYYGTSSELASVGPGEVIIGASNQVDVIEFTIFYEVGRRA